MNTDKKVRQKGPQEIDIVSMVKGIIISSKTILDPNDFLDQLKKIIKESKSDRPGPCLIDIPMDIQSYENHLYRRIIMILMIKKMKK